MLVLIALGVLLIISVYLVQLIKSFGYMSIAELKRRARDGDKTAERVFKARVHGLHVWIVLWGLLSLVLSAIILILDSLLPIAAALVVDVLLLLSMHVFLPWARWPRPSLRLASQVGPVLGAMIYKSGPLLKPIDKLLGGWVEIEATQRIHSKQELLENLQRLPGDLDRIGKDELRIAMHALTFGEKVIHDIMTPKSVVEMLDAHTRLTPVTLGELHQSGFSRFPVYQDTRDNLVGIFYLKDEAARHSRTVSGGMRTEIFYVNENTNLDQVLNAFLRTSHHLFIVVNEYEEMVGVVSIEDVLEQILGRSIIDEFDRYSDLRAVASQRAEQLAQKRAKSKQTHIE